MSIDIDKIESLIGRGTRYEGMLSFESGTRVDGEVRGQIKGDGVLVVGASGVVDAEIDVGALIVLGGSVSGHVVAHQSVELLHGSRVYADLCTPDLFVDNGVHFEGRTTMKETRSHAIDDNQGGEERLASEEQTREDS